MVDSWHKRTEKWKFDKASDPEVGIDPLLLFAIL